MHDQSQINTMFSLIYRRANPSLSVPVLIMQDQSRMKLPPLWTEHALLSMLPWQVARSVQGWETMHPEQMFCVASPTTTFSRPAAFTRAPVPVEGLAITLDLPNHPQESLARLREHLGPPTAVVASGTSWIDPHTDAMEPRLLAHWRLAQPAMPQMHGTLEEVAFIGTILAGFGGGCTAPVGAVARWPGTPNRRGSSKPASVPKDVTTINMPRVIEDALRVRVAGPVDQMATLVEVNAEAEVDLPSLAHRLRAIPLPQSTMSKEVGRFAALANPWIKGRASLLEIHRRYHGY